MLIRLLVLVVGLCRQHAFATLLAGLAIAGLSGWYASGHMRVSTDTDLMFSAELPWRKQAIAQHRDFPQFQDLIVAVIDARIPEEADATAAELARLARADTRNFRGVRRPDASPFFDKYGLLLLDKARLETLMDQTIDAQPFLGQLVADPSARGLFAALALLGMGVTKEDANLEPYLAPLRAFHTAMVSILAGTPRPLSWQNLLGGEVADLAGRFRFVLLQPRLDHGALEPGGAATAALRALIPNLEYVKAGSARVRITGQIPMSDEEFATVAEGAVEDLGPGAFGLGDEIGRCLRGLPEPWRLAGLLALSFLEDLAIVDGAEGTVPWMAVALPSHWAPEDKVGRHFGAIHAPVADSRMLVDAGPGLMRLACGPQRWERFVWTVTDHPRLHAHPRRLDPQRWPAGAATALPQQAWWRTERQTFVPVPSAGQAVFTIAVDVQPLAQALDSPERTRRLRDALATMSPEVRDYRGLAPVHAALLRWLEARAVGP